MDKSCGCCAKGIREYQAVCGHAESKWGNYLWEHTSFEQSMRCGRISMAAQCSQKVDLLLWFYEIELDKESRDITTFATHDALFRYKRFLCKHRLVFHSGVGWNSGRIPDGMRMDSARFLRNSGLTAAEFCWDSTMEFHRIIASIPLDSTLEFCQN